MCEFFALPFFPKNVDRWALLLWIKRYKLILFPMHRFRHNSDRFKISSGFDCSWMAVHSIGKSRSKKKRPQNRCRFIFSSSCNDDQDAVTLFEFYVKNKNRSSGRFGFRKVVATISAMNWNAWIIWVDKDRRYKRKKRATFAFGANRTLYASRWLWLWKRICCTNFALASK